MSCGCGNNPNLIPVFTPSTAQKPVILIAGPGIDIDDQSDSSKFQFEISQGVFVGLEVDMTLVAKILGVAQTMPILKGRVVDEVELSWSYNKAIVSQTLTNTGGLTPPTLDPVTFFHEYTGQNLTSNISFTVSGNDGEGQPGSTDADTEAISFGNLMWIGHGATKDGTATSGIEAFLEGLTSSLKTVRGHTYFATGGVNEHHFVAYPKAWGLATFTKGVFTGGYVRLKNVAGTLKSELGIGDVEIDTNITNSAGFSEAYYIYQSSYDNQNDPVTPFIIT